MSAGRVAAEEGARDASKTSETRDAKAPESGARACVPCIRLFSERVVVVQSGGLGSECEDLEVPLIELSFDYAGTKVRASDPRRRFFSAERGAVATIERDSQAESRARCELERLGAVDLTCLDDYGTAPDSEADYVVRVDGDAHAYCAFTAQALPRLRALGWRIEVDAAYPYQVVDQGVAWYAEVNPEEDLPDWFSLELGFEIDGQRIDLLPLLVDMIDEASESDGLRALLRRVAPCFALRASDTHHVAVSPERFRALLQVVVELYQDQRGRLAFPKVKAAALARLDAAFGTRDGGIKWGDRAGVKKWGDAIAKPARPAPSEPPELRASLRPYQKEGVDFLQHLRECEAGGVLADDMGLGKTLQTIAHLCIEKAEGRLTSPALIVAPTSIVGNWARELARFAPHLRVVALQGARRHALFAHAKHADVVLTSYPLVVRDEERFENQNFNLLVLDEAQTIKNTRSQAHQALKRISADHRLCLTGTPVENHLGELWALFDFLNPGLLGDELCFRRFYRQPIEQLQDAPRLEALREQVAPYILRRLKRDVAKDLPPKTDLFRPVDLEGPQRELYEHVRVAAHADVRKAIRSKGFAASAIPILDALMKLRQICCDPRLVTMEAARGVRESAKYNFLFEMLETHLDEGHRVLIFSQFTSMLALISDGLRERDIDHVALTGATRDRQRAVDAFEKREVDVFLISLKAGGTGLNLTSADTVVHYDPWWNPAAQAQASDRAYRIGQTRPVFVHNLYVAGSVEERILRLQRKKQRLADGLLGAAGPGASLTEQDVDRLFAPLEDATRDS